MKKLLVLVEGQAEPVELELQEVRFHFAFSTAGHAFCLDDGLLFCSAETGARLTPESLAEMQAIEKEQGGPRPHLDVG